jgi:NadR type nicotinamide-nucleotide adenylyltransferase
MLKRIAIIGPESTGKSTLAEDLAEALDTVFVPEYAREYIAELGRPYQLEDLQIIAKGQLKLEDELAMKANQVLIADTTLTVIKVWSKHKYDFCDPWILDEESCRNYDLTLVCDIDLPWEEDPQREHPHLREHFFNLYKGHAQANPPFAVISGGRGERLNKALKEIAQLPKS